MTSSASRLFLAMAEAKVRELGGQHAYMDTDSIFVPPEHAKEIIEYFQPLNPYSLDIGLLKAEKEDVWFYGISSKRYVLYRKEGTRFELVDYKLHGLGHLMNPFSENVSDWQGEIWEDILKLHYELISENDLWAKYGNFYAISRMTVSTSNLLNWFKGLNKGKGWKEQIKPFNFFCLGFAARKENGKVVKPLSPFSRDSQEIVHESFIDYQSGETKQGSEYFKTLGKTILQYIEHNECKFDGDVGLLERKHVYADGVVYIGKEANNIDEQALEVKQPQQFVEKNEVFQKILGIPQGEAERIGVRRGTLSKIKKKIRQGKVLNLKTKALKKLIHDQC